MSKPTIHLIGPGPHSETTKAWEPDAYSAKCRRLGTMLTGKGYRVVLYGGVRNESQVSEFVPLISFEERERWMPSFTPHLEWWTNYDINLEPWRVFNARAAAEIRKRAKPGDILAMTMGSNGPVAEALRDLDLVWVEVGIGYSGVWAPYRVYESRTWEAYLQGRSDGDLREFDTVIPNSYDPAELPEGSGKGGYHLFASRFIFKKGIIAAVLATAALKVPLVVIGPGMLKRDGSTYQGVDVTVSGDHIDHRGTVGPAERARLMGDATCIWSPTLYCEPFGGVVPEALMTGTPAVTSDFGAFVEHIKPEFNGYRARVLQGFVDAGRKVADLDRKAIRADAISRWSTDVAADLYDRYFEQLGTLKDKGWFQLREEGDVESGVGEHVQPGDGAAGGEGDGRGQAPAQFPILGADKVGRRSPRPRARRVGVPGRDDRQRSAVLPKLRAVGD